MTDLQIPVLVGPRLQLEPLSQAHSRGMFELWRDSRVCKHSGPAIDSTDLLIELPADSRSESDRLLGFWVDRAQAGTGFRWAVVLPEESRFAGTVGFNSLGFWPEYAYHLVPRFWGQGIATEASRLALAWSFAQGAQSIESFIESPNVASIRLAERLGFRHCNTPGSEVLRYMLTRSEHAAQQMRLS